MMRFLNNPTFGVLISILSFELGLFIYRKTKIPIFNPLLISMSFIIFFLLKFNIDIKIYNKGGDLISFFLTPATVILAVPLYKQLDLLKNNFIPIIIGILVGCVSAIASVIALINLFHLNNSIGISLIPKSITTPIGIEVSKQLGGIPSVTIVAIVIAGIMGAVVGPLICTLFGIKDKVAVGIAIGTASHALGTTKAMELGETEGAMSGLAIGIAGIITVFLVSLLSILL